MSTAAPPSVSRSESSVVLYNVRWQTYEALLADRGDRGPRIFYDRGTLEIMSPSRRHERLKTLIGRLVGAFSEELNMDISAGGATTLRSQLRARGLEPDESYYVQNEPRVREKDQIDPRVDPPPDLAIEVDLFSQSVDKLDLYASLGVPELWSHDGKGLVVRQLQATGAYAIVRHSAAFPTLPIEDLDGFLDQMDTRSDTKIGRAFRAWVLERLGGGG